MWDVDSWNTHIVFVCGMWLLETQTWSLYVGCSYLEHTHGLCMWDVDSWNTHMVFVCGM